MASYEPCLVESGLTLRQLGVKKGDAEKMSVEDFQNLVDEKKASDLDDAYRTAKNAEAMERLLPAANDMLDRGFGAQRVVMSTMVRDLKDGSKMVGIDQLANGYLAQVGMLLDEVAEAFRPTITGGVRNLEIMDDVVKVLNGAEPKTVQSAKLAGQMRKAMDLMHALHTDAGGTIRQMENWFPQTHNRGAIMSGGRSSGRKGLDSKLAREAWIAYVTPRLDRTKMKTTSGKTMDDAQLAKILDYMYETLSTDGRAHLKMPDFVEGQHKTPFASRHSMQRLLHFDGAKNWFDYNKEYGEGDYWGTFTNTMKGLATDTAAMRVMGADASVNMNNMIAWAAKADNSFQPAGLRATWDNMMGFANNGENLVEGAASTARNLISAAWMGTAAISSIPDVATVMVNAQLNGLSVTRMLAHMNSFQTPAARKQMARVAGHIEYANSAMAQNLRFEENVGSGVSKRLSEANYRLGGMHALQDRLRHAWVQEMMVTLADHRGKGFDKIPKNVRSFMDTYGITAKEWDQIRKADVDTTADMSMLKLGTMTDPHLIAKVLGAINTERDLAVLTPDARVRALLNQGLEPGSAGGIAVRSGTQFMTFTATQLMHGVFRNLASSRLSTGEKVGYTTAMFVAMTTLGGISFQLREMAKGNEPMDMTSKEFLFKAIAYGGAAPAIADLLLDGQTRHGQTATEAVLGPTFGLLSPIYDATYGTFHDYLNGDDWRETLGKSAEAMSKLTPGQSLWWGRAFMQRAIRDSILGAVDESYGERQEQKADYLESQTGQEQWWPYED